jgi:CRP/FNR family transcriptional regulator, anaerobic regulatory protein
MSQWWYFNLLLCIIWFFCILLIKSSIFKITYTFGVKIFKISPLNLLYMLPPEYAPLLQTFSKLGSLSESDFLRIVKNARLVKWPPKKQILAIGQVCNEMYFIIKGCLRLYYVKDIKEINCFFFHEGLFCTAFGSFMMQRPSNQIMETIEETICLCISFDELQSLYQDVPPMNALVRRILEERYTNAHDIISSYILDSPEDRYEAFHEKYAVLVNRLPEYHIASYLGITPKSLSRLKRRAMTKAKKVT